MSLTTKDILEKTFKRSFKGYDEDEVDKFLDEIIDELKLLQNENEALKKEIKSVKELESNIKETEETIMNTLVSAQKSSERILREAARKAELLIDNAENTAKQRAEQTEKDLVGMERKLGTIKQSASNFAMSFMEMINAQTTSFETTYQSFFGDMDAYSSSGINHEALEKIDKSISQDIEEIVGSNESPEEDQPADAHQLNSDDKLEIEWNLPIGDEEGVVGEEAIIPSDLEPPVIKSKEEQGNGLPSSEMSKTEPDALLKTEPEFETSKIENMPINEINKVLTEMEEREDVISESDENKFDDYSWLYGDEKKSDSEFELSFKDPKEGEQLKNLIDDIIE